MCCHGYPFSCCSSGLMRSYLFQMQPVDSDRDCLSVLELRNAVTGSGWVTYPRNWLFLSVAPQSIILLIVVNIEISGLLNLCESISETPQTWLKLHTSLQASKWHIYWQATEPISMSKSKTEVAQVMEAIIQTVLLTGPIVLWVFSRGKELTTLPQRGCITKICDAMQAPRT